MQSGTQGGRPQGPLRGRRPSPNTYRPGRTTCWPLQYSQWKIAIRTSTLPTCSHPHLPARAPRNFNRLLRRVETQRMQYARPSRAVEGTMAWTSRRLLLSGIFIVRLPHRAGHQWNKRLHLRAARGLPWLPLQRCRHAALAHLLSLDPLGRAHRRWHE